MISPEITHIDPAALARARRAARRLGWRVEKSRDRSTHQNNRGGLMLIREDNNIVVDGSDYDLTAEAVLYRCELISAWIKA